MTRLTIATYNSPHRLRPHHEAFYDIAQQADIICAQENADVDPENNCPPGWLFFRPKRAQSNVVYWDPTSVDAQKHGAPKVSSDGFPSPRHLPWVHFRTTEDNKPIRVASAHLPAFKTSKPRNAREFRKQERRIAEWLKGGRFRVIGGDINSTIPSRVWTRNLEGAGDWSFPVKSGPKGQKIDYVGVNDCGPWRVTKTVLGEKYWSDHKAVFATLTWKG